MESPRLVAYNLRRLRVARGISQENLAVDADVDRTYISRLERGIENPTMKTLDKLAKALDAAVVELAAIQAVATLNRLKSRQRQHRELSLICLMSSLSGSQFRVQAG